MSSMNIIGVTNNNLSMAEESGGRVRGLTGFHGREYKCVLPQI